MRYIVILVKLKALKKKKSFQNSVKDFKFATWKLSY